MVQQRHGHGAAAEPTEKSRCAIVRVYQPQRAAGVRRNVMFLFRTERHRQQCGERVVEEFLYLHIHGRLAVATAGASGAAELRLQHGAGLLHGFANGGVQRGEIRQGGVGKDSGIRRVFHA